MYYIKCTNDQCPNQEWRTKKYDDRFEVHVLTHNWTCWCGSELTIGETDDALIEPAIINH